jgi:phospholipid/cholesterol/gamma-HCH transport system permease protein
MEKAPTLPATTTTEPAWAPPSPSPPAPPQKKQNPLLKFVVDVITAIGQGPITFIRETGQLTLFLFQTLWWTPRRPFRWSQLFRHLRDVGFGSLFIVVLTGFFTGLVFGFQTLQGFRRFGAEALVGPATLLTLSRELGPVLTGLMVAGRSGSGMATELGTMRVTEQIDAMATLAVEPIQYLVVPRFWAATFMMPLLTAIFTGCGFFGCYLIGVGREGVDPGVFFFETWQAADPDDFYEGWIKAAFFGAQISLISSYQGFQASGGARGVGEAATRAVVLSSVSILVGTYLLAEILDPLIHGYIWFDAMPK